MTIALSLPRLCKRLNVPLTTISITRFFLIGGLTGLWLQGGLNSSQNWLTKGARIDSKGRAIDNIFVERLWPARRCGTVKDEDIYLKAYADGWESETGLTIYFTFYNSRRFHQSLAYQTPEQVFEKGKREGQVECITRSTNTFVIQQNGPVSKAQYTRRSPGVARCTESDLAGHECGLA